MEIDINQKKISIGDKFQVFIDGVQTHHAAAKIFRVFAEINLFDMNSDFPLITIKKDFLFSGPGMISAKGMLSITGLSPYHSGKHIINVPLEQTYTIFMATGVENILFIKMTARLPGGIKKPLPGLMEIIIKS